MCESCFLQACRTADYVQKEPFGKRCFVNANKCIAFGLQLFPQRLPLYSEGSWLCTGLCVCQLALKRTIHAQSHTRDESVYCPVCSIPAELLRLGFSTHKRKYPSSQVWDKCSQKEEKDKIAKRKSRAEREVASCWPEKKEGALQLEWGVHLICNYPPDDQPVFKVDWLPEVCWGWKF